jgi:hypothetical protein
MGRPAGAAVIGPESLKAGFWYLVTRWNILSEATGVEGASDLFIDPQSTVPWVKSRLKSFGECFLWEVAHVGHSIKGKRSTSQCGNPRVAKPPVNESLSG